MKLPFKWRIFGSANSPVPSKQPASESARQIEIESLEPRILFSAAPVDAEAPDSEAAPAPESADVQLVSAPEVTGSGIESSSPDSQTPESEPVPVTAGKTEISANQELKLVSVDPQSAQLNQEILAAAEKQQERREVAFVSSEVFESGELAEAVSDGPEVFVIDGSRDGIAQIAEILAGRTGIDAVHLYAHGSVGVLEIGTGLLDASSMTGEYADELAVIGAALSENADFLIYGCDFAAGESGLEAAALLSSTLGADVAASTDHTGAQDRGGDWDLELAIGSFETATMAAESWGGILAPSTILVADDGGNDDVTADPNDITALSVDYTNQATGNLVVTVQIDPTTNSGSNTSNIAVIFDTNGDGNANYGFAVSLGGSPSFSVEEFSLVYGKGDGFPDKVSGKTTDIGHWVSGSGWSPGPLLTTYALDTTADDPFDASQDTRVTLNIDLDDILAHWQSLGNPGATYADITLLNATTQPSHSVTSAPKDLGISLAPPFNAVDDTATTAENTPVTFNVATNDSPGLAPSSVELDTPPSNGTVVIGADGEVTYTPTGGFSGVDTFTYHIYGLDGQPRTATATVTVISGSNAPPVANNEGFTVNEDNSVRIDVLDNDSDPDGDSLSITQVDGQAITEGGPAVPVANGTVALVGGELVFTPVLDYNGPASFTYTISDGAESATATVSGTVNPTIGVTIEEVAIGGVTEIEDTTLTFTATLDDTVAGGFTVDVSTVTGTAGAADYTALVNQTLNFTGTAGEFVRFSVIPVDDSIIENPESFTVVMSNVSNTLVDISDTGTGTILDNDARPAGVTTDVELVPNGGLLDLVIEDVRTNATNGFDSTVGDADSIDRLFIERVGSEYVITDLGGLALGSPIVGAIRGASNEIRVSVALVTGSILVSTGIGSDVVTIGDLGDTISGGLFIDAEDPAGRFIDSDLIVYNSTTAMASGGDAEFHAETINALKASSLAATGAGTVYWDAGRNIFMDVGSLVSSETGDIEYEANLAGVSTGNFAGVRLEGADVVSASGNVLLSGQGGTTGNYNSGILLGVDHATATSSTISTSGQIDLTGTGGSGGVHGTGITLVGALVQSTGANSVNITGSGGAGSLFSEGVAIHLGNCEGGHQSIIDAGTGNLNITGTGGSTGSRNRGILVSNTELVSSGGNVELSGTGGGATTGMFGGGTQLTAVDIDTAGSGMITLKGTGNVGTMQNAGLRLSQTTADTVDGAITLEGTGNGTTMANKGVQLLAGSELTSTGSGAIMVRGTGSANGTISNIGVEMESSSRLSVVAGDLTVDGTGGGSSLMGRGLLLANSTLTSSGTGNIEITGTGSTSTINGLAAGIDGVRVTISTTGTSTGTITLTGSGGTGRMLNNGVHLANGSSVSTVGGDITIEGTGRGMMSSGVRIQAVSTVSAGASGNVTVTGLGADGTNMNQGVQVASASTLSTVDGDLQVTGTVRGTGNSLTGVRLIWANLSSSGAGNVLVTGTSTQEASAGLFNIGINMAGGSITTNTGDLTMTGNGGRGAMFNQGIRVVAATLRSTGGGGMSLAGTADSSNTGLFNTGVYLIAVKLDTSGAVDISGTGGGTVPGGIGLNHGIFMLGITQVNGPTITTDGMKGDGTFSKDEDGNFFP